MTKEFISDEIVNAERAPWRRRIMRSVFDIVFYTQVALNRHFTRWAILTALMLCLPGIFHSLDLFRLAKSSPIIAITEDWWLKLAIQAKSAQVSGGTKAPLASGGIDWTDQKGSTTLKEVLVKAGCRELIEEWGKRRRLGTNRTVIRIRNNKIQPIGFFRMPHQGGKPEFVVFTKIENKVSELFLDFAEVYSAETSATRETLFKVENLRSLNNAVDDMLKGGSAYKDSVPLYGSLLCLKDAITNNAKLICDIAGFEHDA
jgi:hypothetical protein